MELQSLEQLEENITDLTERFLSLKEENKKMRGELNHRNSEMEDLHEKLRLAQEVKEQIHSKVEGILRKLEILRAQVDQ